jgi:hypothetical protein
MMKARRLLIPAAALAITTLAFAREARAANFAPACTGTTGDSAALIAAITTSNGNGEADTITLMAGCTYELSTVNNTSGANGDNGLPVIQADGSDASGSALTIMGNGAKITRASAAPAFRLLEVNGGVLNLNNVTLSNGSAASHGGALTILAGAVVLTNSTVSGNTAADWGGGIQIEDGSLDIRSSTISGNTTPSDSAGINIDGGNVTVVNSTITGNTSPQQGGGIGNFGDPGIVPTSLVIINSTIAGNTADEGGGLWNSAGGATTTVTNTIVALNNAGPVPDAGAGVDAGPGFAPDIGGFNYVDGGNNLIGNATGTPAFALTTLKGTAAAKIDPLLGPLASNGGPTQTRALLAGSPALNAANATVCAAAPVSGVDQRAVARTGSCDIGSFEGAGTAADASVPDSSSGTDASSTTDSGTIESDSGTIGDLDSGKPGTDAGGDDAVVPSSSSSCSCDNAGAPANALGLSALVMGAALLVARRRRR